jgi:hypothetical protein
LESLSRNGNSSVESDETVEEERRKHVNRHVSSETIERNLENINGAGMDETQSTDPMFQKMSKAFDEGGAKGMLMNNMVRDISPGNICQVTLLCRELVKPRVTSCFMVRLQLERLR